MRKICKECGKEFETNSSKRIFCYDDHYRVCKSCGKKFLVNPSSKKVTCSEACRRKAISSAEVYRTPRYKLTCVLCGKEFMSASYNSKLCPDKHFLTCKVCGKPFEITEFYQIDRQTCSNECRYKLSPRTFSTNSAEHLAKTRKTMLDRYGYANAMQIPEVKERVRQACMTKYGVSSFTKTPQFIEASIKTNRERYGTDWYMQTDKYKNSVIQTCLSRYGVTNPSMSASAIADKMTCPEKLDELMQFRANPKTYIEDHFEVTPTLRQLADRCGIKESSVSYILRACNLSYMVNADYSRMEDEVFEFLVPYLGVSNIVRNTFQVIKPYELDIYIPGLNFAIECDPTWTHNSSQGIYKESPISPRYHRMKTDLCEAKGIRLFHLFGYDWENHKDTCKSMLLNAIGKTPTRYYARKLCLKTVSDSDAYAFLESNHRQGGVHCKVNLGLYSEDTLLSLMTFSKMRHTIGTGKDMTVGCWELVRFCNLNYTNVVGGASRLLKYFIKNYAPVEIRSFSDRAHTSGGLYPKLGFTKVRQSKPGYMWVSLKTNKAYARFNAQKRNIKKFLNDDTVDLSKTEVQIMTEHGYVQVFDSGTITWKLQVKG